MNCKIFFFCFTLLFSSRTLSFAEETPTQVVEKPILENEITYGQAGEEELKLDLARPDGEGPYPAIVFIHGGGWAFGHRATYHKRIKEAAEKGYVAITVSYRLMKFDQENKEKSQATPIFPAQVHDVKAAVRWLRANAKKYHVNPDKIGVTGQSAGGHLSLMVGLTDPSAGLEGNNGNEDFSSRVQAVVNEFGPTEMEECFHKSSVAWCFRLFMGGNPDEVPDTYQKASPISYVSKDDPPVLSLQGDIDKLVPVTQATLLDQKMEQAGANHELLILKNQGHGFKGEDREKASQALWDFFDKHLKN